MPARYTARVGVDGRSDYLLLVTCYCATLMKDRSPEVIDLAATILVESNAALVKAESVPPSAFDKSSVAFELLMILRAAEELQEFFDPPIYPIACLGRPRSAVEMRAEPQLILRSDEGFDFSTWYAEKSAWVKQSAARLVSDWRRGLDEVRIHPEGPPTREEAYVHNLIRNLADVQTCAQVIYDMTFDRRVTVQEIRFRPEHSN